MSGLDVRLINDTDEELQLEDASVFPEAWQGEIWLPLRILAHSTATMHASMAVSGEDSLAAPVESGVAYRIGGDPDRVVFVHIAGEPSTPLPVEVWSPPTCQATVTAFDDHAGVEVQLCRLTPRALHRAGSVRGRRHWGHWPRLH